MPKFNPATASEVVTMFQPTRPWLTWSSVRIDRARLYGWLNVVEAVRTSPKCWVERARRRSAVIRKGRRVGQKQHVEQRAFTNSGHVLIMGDVVTCLPLAAR